MEAIELVEEFSRTQGNVHVYVLMGGEGIIRLLYSSVWVSGIFMRYVEERSQTQV